MTNRGTSTGFQQYLSDPEAYGSYQNLLNPQAGLADRFKGVSYAPNKYVPFQMPSGTTLPGYSQQMWGTNLPRQAAEVAKTQLSYLDQMPDWLTHKKAFPTWQYSPWEQETEMGKARVEEKRGISDIAINEASKMAGIRVNTLGEALKVLKEHGYGSSYAAPGTEASYEDVLSELKASIGEPAMPEAIDPRVYAEEQMVGVDRQLREALQAESANRASLGFAASGLRKQERRNIYGIGAEQGRMATLSGLKARDEGAELNAQRANKYKLHVADLARQELASRRMAGTQGETTRAGLVRQLLASAMG